MNWFEIVIRCRTSKTANNARQDPVVHCRGLARLTHRDRERVWTTGL